VSDFEGQIWAVQDNDNLNFVCTTKRVKNKLQVLTEKGRDQKLSEDKLLWQHPRRANTPEEWSAAVSEIYNSINRIRSAVDIRLLWESALELEVSAMDDLADLYFGGEISTEHLAAIWLILADDRLFFKRKAQAWEPRSAEQVNELKLQRDREQARAKEKALANDWLQQATRAEKVSLPEELTEFANRLDGWLIRGDQDKGVEELVGKIAENTKQSARELVFDLLQKLNRLPADADRDVMLAGLKPEFSAPVQEAAAAIELWQPSAEQTVTELLFSIDDEDTREVDDALGIQREGDQWVLSIAIADPATLIHSGDTIDREAMRRGTTVYLPTQTVLMIPERVSCDLASLNENVVRSSIVVRVWIDDAGNIADSKISREPITVKRRLHYVDADQVLRQAGEIPADLAAFAEPLQQLSHIAQQRQAQRVAEGAFNLQRPEYKISIDGDEINVSVLDRESPSRLLVAEMMILANHVAARYAYLHQVPLIYRTQDPPAEPITPEMLADPLGFYKVRKLLKPSSLSLHAGGHSGLGLSVYTQLSSPLRRFADLVMQRQLLAHLLGEELPYDQEELFKVLATADRTAREAKQAENEAKRRWFVEYLNRYWQNKPMEILMLDSVKGGYKVELRPWGVEAFLGVNGPAPELGSTATALLDKAKVKTGQIRLKLAPSA